MSPKRCWGLEMITKYFTYTKVNHQILCEQQEKSQFEQQLMFTSGQKVRRDVSYKVGITVIAYPSV
jgi:hypothetical protein